LFVEDISGTVSQILLSVDTVNQLTIDVDNLEGTSQQFNGLLVQDRVTRDRSGQILILVLFWEIFIFAQIGNCFQLFVFQNINITNIKSNRTVNQIQRCNTTN